MHTKDFIAQIEALPFVGEVVEYGADILMLWSNDGYSILSIDKGKFFNVRTDENGFEDLTEHQKSVLMDVVYPYISTPVDSREPERRFRLMDKPELNKSLTNPYLNMNKETGRLMNGGSVDNVFYKTIFTDSELKDLFTPAQLDWIDMTFDKEWIDE